MPAQSTVVSNSMYSYFNLSHIIPPPALAPKLFLIFSNHLVFLKDFLRPPAEQLLAHQIAGSWALSCLKEKMLENKQFLMSNPHTILVQSNIWGLLPC